MFVETQLTSTAAKLDHVHMLDVIRKTARKMSPAALALVADVPLGPAEQALITEALAP